MHDVRVANTVWCPYCVIFVVIAFASEGCSKKVAPEETEIRNLVVMVEKLGGHVVADKFVELRNTTITPDQLAELLAQPGMRHMTALNVNRCKALGDEGLKILAASANTAGLTELLASGINAGDAGIIALATSAHFRPKKLALYKNHIGVKGAQALANSAVLSQVKTLYLGSNPLGDDGVTALANGTAVATIRELLLPRVKITSKGARALIESRSLTAVEHLWLNGSFDNDVLFLVANPANLPALKALEVSSLPMGLIEKVAKTRPGLSISGTEE